jgi:aspartyl-tRNA(Asn)/glutamyl-tRNA(Gln) amidotransferase subunit A
MSEDLCMMPAIDLVAAYRARRLSPVEVTRAVLERIARYDPALNAFILVTEKEAMAAAQASEARWMRGEPVGLLDGVPTTVKDVVLMKGHPTRRGSRGCSPACPPT